MSPGDHCGWTHGSKANSAMWSVHTMQRGKSPRPWVLEHRHENREFVISSTQSKTLTLKTVRLQISSSITELGADYMSSVTYAFLLVYTVSVCCVHMQMSRVCVRVCVASWQGLMSESARLHRPVAPLPYKCHLFPASDLHNAKLLSRNGPISGGSEDHSWRSNR